MSKMIKTTDTEVKVDESRILVIEIGTLSFEVDERFPWISVYLTGEESKEFITEIDEEDMPVFTNHEELKRFCLNWYFNNVEIVNEARTAPEVPVQEQYEFSSKCNICSYENKLKVTRRINPKFCMNCGEKITYQSNLLP